jgi:competence ComEA-like helix-hairpin-helix protein
VESSPISAIGAVVVCLGLVALATVSEGRTADPVRASPGRDTGARSRVTATGPTLSALRQGRPIDLNTASASDLELLPAIGPKLALRITAYRQQHGPFLSVEELSRVSGIGPKKLERIQPLLVATAKYVAGRNSKLTKENDVLDVKHQVKGEMNGEVSRPSVESREKYERPYLQSEKQLSGKKIVEPDNAVSRGVDGKLLAPQAAHPIYPDPEVWDELQDIQ